MAKLNVNGRVIEVAVEDDTPLLWVIREHVGLTGTKYGCGVGACGACTLHVDGVATRSCALPVSAVGPDQKIVTIEGLGAQKPHPVQEAWAELDVCPMRLLPGGHADGGLRAARPESRPSDDDIRAEISNICRCGTYGRVLAGVKLAAERMSANRG